MNKEFEKLQKKVRQIESEIKTETTRLSETEAVLSEVIRQIGEGTERLKVFLLARNTTAADKCKAEISELEKQRGFAELLIPALQTKGEWLDTERTEAKLTLNEKFAKLAREWLSDEVRTYDAIAGNLIAQLRKLFACSKLLHDRDHPNVYRDTLGDGHKVLMNLKIPVLENFDIGEFNDPARKFSLSQDDINRVKDEIIK